VTYLLHPGAESDIENASDFYAVEAGVGVAKRFLSEFERVAQLLVANPAFGTPVSAGRRWFPLRVFPYSVVYRALGSEIQILVVRHQHRKPGFGMRRKF
jgi:plasmid stabilization system protein ParE